MTTIIDRCIESLAHNLSIWESENHDIEYGVISDSGSSKMLLICACLDEDDFERIKGSKVISGNGATYNVIGSIEGIAKDKDDDALTIEFDDEKVMSSFFDSSGKLKAKPKFYSRAIVRRLEELEAEKKEKKMAKREAQKEKRRRRRRRKAAENLRSEDREKSDEDENGKDE